MQAAIFAFALQIRSPVIWAVLALSAFWLIDGVLALRRGRSLRSLCDWRQSRSAPVPITVLAVLLSAQLLAARNPASALPRAGRCTAAYVLAGPAVVSAAKPEWAANTAASVNNATGDTMPEEVARIAIMKLPPEERQQYLRPRWLAQVDRAREIQPNRVLRHTMDDPKFVAHAFFIDKPGEAWGSEQQFFGGLFAGLPIWSALIPAPAVVPGGFGGVECGRARRRCYRRRRDSMIYRPLMAAELAGDP